MEYSLENTNAITAQQFLEQDPSKDTLKWKVENTQDKGKKPPIAKYYIEKGTIGGVGSAFGGTIVLKGLQSKFPSHPFSFDEAKKDLIGKPLADLLANKESMSFKELNDLVKLSLTFQLYTEETNYQPAEAATEIKAVEEMHRRICQTIKGIQTDTPKNPNFVNAGFLQTKYDNYLSADATKLTVDMKLVNTSSKPGFDSSVEIVTYDSASGQFKDLKAECNSIQDYILLLRNRRMDIVAYFDSCCIKKMGRDVTLIPKLFVHQIVIHDYVRKQHSTIGLNFSK